MPGRSLELLNGKTIEFIFHDMIQRRDFRVELDSLCFVDPFGLLSLLVLGRALAEESGDRVPLRLPDNEELLHYLVRMDFPTYAVDWFESSGPDLPADVHRRRAASMVLLEVTSIETSRDVLGVVQLIRERLTGILRTQLGYSEIDVHNFAVAVSEMCQNIPDHAGCSGLVAVQRYANKRTGKNFVKIAVADSGVGIRASLGPRYAGTRTGAWTDLEAIKTAFERGVSRVEDPGRGQGLKRVREMVKNWGGTMLMRSGSARLRFQGAQSRRQADDGLSPFPGTQLLIELPQID